MSASTPAASNGRRSFFQNMNIGNPLAHRHGVQDDIDIEVPSAAQLEAGNVARDKRKQNELVAQGDQLAMFRTLVGIDNPPGLHASTFFRSTRPAQNIGIYSRVISAETKAHRSHQTFAWLINASLGLQLIVAAALTALGAGNGPHKAVTAFGALNTVIAGFLAFLKGSGLPNRLQYYESEWTKIREYIEQRERDFCREGCNLDLEAEVHMIERMYEEVKGDIEANTPDGFISVQDITKRRAAIGQPPVFTNISNQVLDSAVDRYGEPASRSVAALKRNLSYQSSQVGERMSGYGEKATGYKEELARYGEKATEYGNKGVAIGEKAVGIGERLSSFTERPYTVTIGPERAQSPPTTREEGEIRHA